MSGSDRPARTIIWCHLIVVLLLFPQVIHGQEQNSNLEMNYDIGRYKYITRGADLTLTCKNKLNTKYPEWSFPHGLQNRIDVQHGVSSNVTVKKANDDITGTYRCSIDYTKPDGGVVKVENSIQVVALPLITVKVANVSVEDGQQLTLECTIDGGVPAPSFQQWDIKHVDVVNHERNKLPENDDQYGGIPDIHTVTKSTERWTLEKNSQDKANGRLVINRVQLDDAGTYTCVAKNVVGEERKSIIVNVTEIPTTTTSTTTTTTTIPTTKIKKLITGDETQPVISNGFTLSGATVKPGKNSSKTGITTSNPGNTNYEQGSESEKAGNTNKHDGDGGLAGGVIAAIVVGVLIIVIGAATGLYFLVFQRKGGFKARD